MKPEPEPSRWSALIVMGVSGTGKSTIAALLAQRLGWTYEDGDWFHPAGNVDKMHAGRALTDEDRAPWLLAIAAALDARLAEGEHLVIACSALKRRYRDVLIGARKTVGLVYLRGERPLIERRLAARLNHFMPPSLLDSQLDALEPPQGDEQAIVVSIDAHPREIVESVVRALADTRTKGTRA